MVLTGNVVSASTRFIGLAEDGLRMKQIYPSDMDHALEHQKLMKG